MQVITSKSNTLIKATKKLLHKKYRKESYLIEGWHLFEEAKKAKVPILRIFVLEEYLEKIPSNLEIILVTPDILKELSDSKTPQGIVTEISFMSPRLEQLPKGNFLVLEDVQDPGNLGTLIRTADAAGLSAVFITDKSVDIYNQKTLRSMQGSHFHLPIYRLPIEKIFKHLREAELLIIGTTLSDQSVDYRTLSGDTSFALVMGNEGNGISEFVTSQSDVLAHINMPGQAESLNVAIAAAIILFSLI